MEDAGKKSGTDEYEWLDDSIQETIIRGVSGLRSVGLLRSDTKRFCDGVLFDPQKRNLNSSNRGTFEGVSGLQSGGPFRRYMFPHGRLPLGRWKYPQL